MKILNFNKAGNPADVLSFTEKEKPVPGNNEVLIKVLGSPIQPADYFFINGTYRFKPEFPQTAGLEGAGIIESPGKNVPDVTGKLVSFLNEVHGLNISLSLKNHSSFCRTIFQ